jgi:thiol-disulfide isomerase/thioredoxin
MSAPTTRFKDEAEMTDPQEPPPQATPAQMRAIARRLILPHVFLVAAMVAASLYFVLYVMNGGRGKEAAKEAAISGQCGASKSLAARIAPLAKGEFSALAVRTDPKPMPGLQFSGPVGATTLESFKGGAILLNAWATWCVPCREEMPALDRLQGAEADKFAVVAVNVDTTHKERAREFLAGIGVKNLRFYEDADGKSFEALRKSGQLLGLPASFLIGPDGCEIAALAGSAKWDGPEAMELINAVMR